MASVAIWFWVCFSIVLYTFLGYGIILYLLVIFKRIFSPSIQIGNSIFEPPVTLVVPCFNEAGSILNKIANCQLLDYPTDKLTLVFIMVLLIIVKYYCNNFLALKYCMKIGVQERLLLKTGQ